MDELREEAEAQAAGRPRKDKCPRKKLEEGPNLLRLLPPFVKGKPWRKVLVAFGIGNGDRKSVIVPRRQYGLEPDPFMDHIEKLSSKNDKASQAQLQGMNSIAPRERFNMWVIDRNNEEAGPQLFETNSQVVEMLRKFFFDPEYGDLSDPLEGTDFTINYIPKEKNVAKKGKFPAWDVVPKRKTSPLHPDEAVRDTWLAEDLFEKYRIGFPTTAEAMEAILNDALADFKGPWKTRPDGTPLVEDDEDSAEETETKQAVAEAKAPPKGAAATDKIKAMLGGKK